MFFGAKSGHLVCTVRYNRHIEFNNSCKATSQSSSSYINKFCYFQGGTAPFKFAIIYLIRRVCDSALVFKIMLNKDLRLERLQQFFCFIVVHCTMYSFYFNPPWPRINSSVLNLKMLDM